MRLGIGPGTKRILSASVSIGLLGFVYTRVPLSEITSRVTPERMGWLLGALVLIYPILLITAWRFWVIVRRVSRSNLSYWSVVYMVYMSSIANLILPAKLGDLTKIYWLKQDKKIGRARALASVIFEKCMDTLSVLSYAIVGVIYFYPQLPHASVVVGPVVLGFIIILFVVLNPNVSMLISKWMYRWLPKKIKKPIIRLLYQWRQVQSQLSHQKSAYWQIGGISLLNSAALSIQFWIMAVILGATIPVTYVLGILPLVVLCALFPFTLAGLGIREGALLLFFSHYLAPADIVILGALTALRFTMLIPVMMIRNPLELRSKKDTAGNVPESVSESLS